MVAVRLARGWVGYGGVVHRAGETVDVDPVTLARLEASGVVTPADLPEPMHYGSKPDGDDERTVAWAGPTSEDPDRTMAWAGPTSDDDDQDSDWAGPTAQRTV